MIIHLSGIKPNIKKMSRQEAKAQFTLTKHDIVSTKQDNLGTHVGLQETKKNIREENLMLYYPILCFYSDVHIVFSCEHACICRTLNAFQTHAYSLFTVVALVLFPSE